MKIGFDNNKYLTLQAQHIRARREQFPFLFIPLRPAPVASWS